MPDSSDNTLARLATSSNDVELESWHQALKEAGIPVEVQRQHSMYPRRYAEIWVLESDVEDAKAILTKLLPRGKTADLYFGW